MANRTEAQIRESCISHLIKNGMPSELAARAIDSWVHLAGENKALSEMMVRDSGIVGSAVSVIVGSAGWWAQYCFMQGFVAGHMAAVHHN